MQTYEEFAELAGIRAKNAHLARQTEVGRVLWKMAHEYQEKAAKLDHGQLIDIGEPPPGIE
ncbi:MAG: hypothetical protein ABSG46_11530 [Candidatus Binataceae bacterium]|jgi:hypothetical protein